MLLEVININTYYGMSQVLFDVSLAVEKGERVVLLGRNGAGKTTTMISINGLNPPPIRPNFFQRSRHHRHPSLSGRPSGHRLCP